MSYWSDERDILREEIKMINDGAIRKSKENAELKEENEKLKAKIKNLEWSLTQHKISSGRWDWYGESKNESD